MWQVLIMIFIAVTGSCGLQEKATAVSSEGGAVVLEQKINGMPEVGTDCLSCPLVTSCPTPFS